MSGHSVCWRFVSQTSQLRILYSKIACLYTHALWWRCFVKHCLFNNQHYWQPSKNIDDAVDYGTMQSKWIRYKQYHNATQDRAAQLDTITCRLKSDENIFCWFRDIALGFIMNHADQACDRVMMGVWVCVCVCVCGGGGGISSKKNACNISRVYASIHEVVISAHQFIVSLPLMSWPLMPPTIWCLHDALYATISFYSSQWTKLANNYISVCWMALGLTISYHWMHWPHSAGALIALWTMKELVDWSISIFEHYDIFRICSLVWYTTTVLGVKASVIQWSQLRRNIVLFYFHGCLTISVVILKFAPAWNISNYTKIASIHQKRLH